MPARPPKTNVRHPHDAGKARLKNLVQTADSVGPQLPFVHSTDTYRFGDVVSEGSIVPKNCPVFGGELLTYLFYGRPAYRPNAHQLGSTLDHYLPVCIIFRRDCALELERVFPFDTGAFQEKHYESFMHQDMKLGDFALEADSSTPGRVIDLFFGSVYDYLKAKPSRPAPADPSQFEANSYAALINVSGSNSVDSRSSAIEVQITAQLKLANVADAIVLPSTFVDGEIGRALRKHKIKLLPYDVVSRQRPSDYASTIETTCKTFYLHRKILKKENF
jgi:hypothetical protein